MGEGEPTLPEFSGARVGRYFEPASSIVCGHGRARVPATWRLSFGYETPSFTVREDRPGIHGLIPGLIGPEVWEQIQDDTTEYLQLAGANRLISPRHRQQFSQVSRLEYDRLAVAAHGFGWLEAYAQYFGNNIHCDAMFLCREGWQRFVEGGYDIALRLTERAAECARNPMQRSLAQTQAQGIRIPLMRFREAADEDDPSPVVPPTARAFLLQCKGWGLVMTDHAADAEKYFQAAHDIFKSRRNSRECLYLLNIWALNKLKLNDFDGALALENKIEKALKVLDDRDWHLEYINFLNTARLYRRRHSFDKAKQYYDLAFDTTLGIRSESDSIYANICSAYLHAEHGFAAEAFTFWLRSALHWVSSAVPEALASRVARAILQRPPLEETVTEDVSRVFTDRLLAAANAIGLNPKIGSGIPPVFVKSSSVPIALAVGSDGWAVLISLASVPARFDGANYLRLCALIHDLLQILQPSNTVSDARTIVVDDRFGCEIATTAAELLETSVRLHASRMHFGKMVISLDEEKRAILDRVGRVRLGSAVKFVDFSGPQAIVHFKRYIPPKPLSGGESRIVEVVEKGIFDVRTILNTIEGDIRSLRALECSRIIHIYLGEDDCKGIIEEIVDEKSCLQ